jgi:hypothetical protein
MEVLALSVYQSACAFITHGGSSSSDESLSVCRRGAVPPPFGMLHDSSPKPASAFHPAPRPRRVILPRRGTGMQLTGGNKPICILLKRLPNIADYNQS